MSYSDASATLPQPPELVAFEQRLEMNRQLKRIADQLLAIFIVLSVVIGLLIGRAL